MVEDRSLVRSFPMWVRRHLKRDAICVFAFGADAHCYVRMSLKMMYLQCCTTASEDSSVGEVIVSSAMAAQMCMIMMLVVLHQPGRWRTRRRRTRTRRMLTGDAGTVVVWRKGLFGT